MTAAEQLRTFLERIERLEEEKTGLTTDVKAVYAEAKAVGFDPKIMRQVVKLRAMREDERHEQQHLLSLYMRELGL